MGLMYDPITKEWYDDGSGEFGGAGMFGGTTTPFMGGDLFNVGLGDWNKSGMEPYEQADVNQGFTTFNNVRKALSDPMTNYMIAVQTGADTFDFGQLAGGGMGMYGGAGGGGGGGGGMGGGYQSVYTTPWSDSATASSDPFMKQIAVDVAAGKDPGTIVLQMMERGDFDQDQLDVYSNAANQMFQERSGFQRNQLNPAQPEQTAMQKWLAATGLPDPTEEYTPETLPADVMPDLNPALARYYKRFTDLDERAKKWAKDARYGPVPSADASADAASALPTEVNGIPIVRQTAADYQAKDTDWIDKIEELRRRGPGQAQRMTGMTPEKWNAYLDRQLQLGRNGEGAGGGGGGGITARSNIDAPAFNAMSAAGLNARAPSGVRGGGPLSLSAIKAQAAADAGEDDLRYTVPGSGAPAWAPGGGGGPRRTNLAGRVTARLQRKAQQERERAQRHQQDVGELAMLVAQKQGRSPARDRLNAQIQFMRSQGIGI